MNLSSSVPVVVALAGMLTYILASNLKAAELGRLAFVVGLLVTLWMFAGGTFSAALR